MFDGIINIYKEQGFTSHDVVAKLRGILKQKKIGHTGTLDPAAEGVLPVCLGKGTKLCDMLTDKSKTYQAVLLLGTETDTQDTTGTILKQTPYEHLDEKQVTEAVMSFVGSYEQIPPMYSALKVNGKKLYELAREGIEVERKARHVEIFSITIDEITLPRVTMTVHCSKGTYIRTLCHDIGEKLGCGGCMERLLRTQVGAFLLKDSIRLSEAEQLVKEGKIAEKIYPVEAMFRNYAALVSGNAFLDRLLANGNPFAGELAADAEIAAGEHLKRTSVDPDSLTAAEGSDSPVATDDTERLSDLNGLEDGMCFRVYDSRRQFIGIYEYKKAEERWKPKKIFLGGN